MFDPLVNAFLLIVSILSNFKKNFSKLRTPTRAQNGPTDKIKDFIFFLQNHKYFKNFVNVKYIY